jgi:hypothetical protein
MVGDSGAIPERDRGTATTVTDASVFAYRQCSLTRETRAAQHGSAERDPPLVKSYFAAFKAAQRFFCARAIFLRVAALKVRFTADSRISAAGAILFFGGRAATFRGTFQRFNRPVQAVPFLNQKRDDMFCRHKPSSYHEGSLELLNASFSDCTRSADP